MALNKILEEVLDDWGFEYSLQTSLKDVEEAKKKLSKIKKLLEDGLCNDGGHHKQWALAELYKILYDKDEMEPNAEISMEEGIAP